uniref:SH2 domain-containing protein n=1 Tax=Setaria digitata TaxID=48799 RepID=A0A915PVW8_9BILA
MTNEIPVFDDNMKNFDDKESDSSPSPPSYAVFEDEHGNLVNRALNVAWPARPCKGRYSLNEYRERKQRFREYNRKSEKNKEYVKGQGKQSDASHARVSTKIRNNSNIYVGARPISSLRSILRPRKFCLFYMRPESINSLNQMPIKMPLMLAYMSSSGTVYNFSFKEYQHSTETFWQVDLSSIRGPEQPIFRSIAALVDYYQSFVINEVNGKSEIFPVEE